MLHGYERGNENFTSGESYRKSNKVCLQVRRTEWNITPHNQRLPDQYSSHRRGQLPASFYYHPFVCQSESKIEIPAVWAIVLSSLASCRTTGLCLQQVVSLPASAKEPRRRDKKCTGVTKSFPLLSVGDLMLMTVSVKLEGQWTTVTNEMCHLDEWE